MISLSKLNNPNNFNLNVKPNVNVNVSTIKNDIPTLMPDGKEIIKNDPNISEYIKHSLTDSQNGVLSKAKDSTNAEYIKPLDSDSVSVHYPSSV